jgi:hypothetical protein
MRRSFSVGGLVRVRSRGDIASGLHPTGRRDGCLMMEHVELFSRTFKIIKVVFRLFDENQYEMFQVRSPLYILENLICEGASEALGETCDRSCHLFSHEDWLQSATDGSR